MFQKDNILNELKELYSSLTGGSANIYSVPAGYFENLAGEVLKRIKAMESANSKEELELLSPYLNAISRQMPYGVPDKYFETLDTDFVWVDESKELETLSPLLNSLKKQPPYSVPDGYFEQVSLPAVASTKEPAKMVTFNSRRWIRYAAAAVITGLIVFAGFLIGNKKEEGQRIMARIEKSVKKMDEVQKDKLLDFIDAGLSGNETVQMNPDNKTAIKDLLQGVSEQELNDFQEQTEDIEDVLMTN